MKRPITNALVAISLASFLFVFLVVIGGLVLFFQVYYGDRRAGDAKDSVLVISSRVAELHAQGTAPTQTEIDESIRQLVTGSVINAGLDAQQRPIDPYGTPFRIRHRAEGTLHRVTATSAGPDRQFDTADDISRESTWKTLPPPAKQ
jgi:hypothetical protein